MHRLLIRLKGKKVKKTAHGLFFLANKYVGPDAPYVTKSHHTMFNLYSDISDDNRFIKDSTQYNTAPAVFIEKVQMQSEIYYII